MSRSRPLLLALFCTSCAASEDGPGGTPGDSATADSATAADTSIATDTSVRDSSATDGAIDDTSIAADSTPSDAGADTATSDSGGDSPADASADVATDTTKIDAAPPTGLRIDELYVDLDLSGDAVEFVEIAGPVGASLDGLHLRLIDATGKVKYDVAVTTGKTIGASGRWVVGGNKTDTFFSGGRLDQSVGIASWGLDNTAGAVQLVSGTTLLDVVGWGSKVAAPSTPPTATYETDVVTLPTTVKRSMARNAGVDTGDNKSDFCPQVGSPGSAGAGCTTP